MHAVQVHGLFATATDATVRVIDDGGGGGCGGGWSWYRRISIISSLPCTGPNPPCLPVFVYDDDDDNDDVVVLYVLVVVLVWVS